MNCERCSDTGWEHYDQDGQAYARRCPNCNREQNKEKGQCCPDCHDQGSDLILGKRCSCGRFPLDRLPWGVAYHWAHKLKTIGPASAQHQQSLDVMTIASDLVAWCHGAIIGEKIWTPDEQVEWLVTTARWHWREWRGSAQLYHLFRQKFDPENAGPT